MTASPALPRSARRAPSRSAAVPSAAASGAAVAALVARLEAGVAAAGVRARANGRPVLVSAVVAAPAVDPLDALAALDRGTTVGAASRDVVRTALRDGRTYWARPTDGFAFAAVGAVAALTPTGDARYSAAERDWTDLLRDAVIDTGAVDGSEVVGVGPLLVGGFAFDPAGARAAHWRGFPAARLVLPRVQLTATAGAHWLTATLRVDAAGRPDEAPDAVGRLALALVGARGDGESGDADAAADADGRTPTPTDVLSAASWRALAGAAAAAVRAGALEKVVLARAVQLSAPHPFDVMTALRRLRARYPDCYVFGCWAPDGAAFVGASPERLVRLDGALVRATSLAGTARRGESADADATHAAALLASAKERREHAVVRDWLVGALGDLCTDVEAAAAPTVRALPNLFHLHTDVRARLCPGRSLFDLVARLHPTPAVGGAPREAALAFLAAHEHLDRGWYAAPVGWIGRGAGEFAVALRSAVVRGAEAWLFAGCGIVGDSDPDREYAESMLKLRPMEQALGEPAPGEPAPGEPGMREPAPSAAPADPA